MSNLPTDIVYIDSNRMNTFEIHWEADRPIKFRVAQYPDGRRIVQGGYPYQKGAEGGIKWRDLPVVQVDENGDEITLR